MTAGQVGRYRLEEVIGVGSFATVHRAVDGRLDDTVVVKILAENHSLNPEVRERFITEGRSLRRIRSPHVVTVHDIGESERQQPYLVLEHADRGTLAERVAALRAQGWAAGPGDILLTARALAAAVEAVHAAQLVHRDLSPGNVLLRSAPAGEVGHRTQDLDGAWVVRPDERLVVADLGMCKDLARSSGLTVAGGTSGFRPPEQRGPGLVDYRADLWSLSRLLLWLCEGSDVVPAALLGALRRSLADDPDDRHPDIASWLADVEAALAPPPLVPGPVTTGEVGRQRWRRAGFGLVAGIVLALLVGAVAGVFGARWLDADPAQTANAAVAIVGPDEIGVGEEAAFTASVRGSRSWVWALPTGEFVADESVVTLTPTSPGTAELVLRARSADGTDLEVIHQIRAVE